MFWGLQSRFVYFVYFVSSACECIPPWSCPAEDSQGLVRCSRIRRISLCSTVTVLSSRLLGQAALSDSDSSRSGEGPQAIATAEAKRPGKRSQSSSSSDSSTSKRQKEIICHEDSSLWLQNELTSPASIEQVRIFIRMPNVRRLSFTLQHMQCCNVLQYVAVIESDRT